MAPMTSGPPLPHLSASAPLPGLFRVCLLRPLLLPPAGGCRGFKLARAGGSLLPVTSKSRLPYVPAAARAGDRVSCPGPRRRGLQSRRLSRTASRPGTPGGGGAASSLRSHSCPSLANLSFLVPPILWPPQRLDRQSSSRAPTAPAPRAPGGHVRTRHS